MMPIIPLRKLVSAIGLAVAITVAVATPSVYFIHDYINASAKLTFKARLNVARVAQYIYTHDGIWQYQQDSVAIVRAVVGLSSSLGITTTAEGVETKEQLASVTAEGCNEFQGFLYSRPQT